MTRAALGLDTSCYTTSCALAFEDGAIDQRRRLLDVPAGERGLQQSKALFQHVTRLHLLVEELMAAHEGVKIAAVCASVRPRPVDGSYMPVFTVSEGAGRSIAAALGVPFFPTSHQQGHIRAAMYGTALKPEDTFLALHLSGGTTEIVLARAGDISLIGGTNDLHAGQFIDRVGVALGLGFPAGPALEQMALKGAAKALLPIWVRGMECSFSGAESAAQRMIAAGTLSPEDMAAEVFSCVSRTIGRIIAAAAAKTGERKALICGGVASSQLMRALVKDRLRRLDADVTLCWGRPELSGDNACGPALIGADRVF